MAISLGPLLKVRSLSYLLANPLENTEKTVENIMGEAFPVVTEELPFSQLGKYFNKKIPAVMARDKAGENAYSYKVRYYSDLVGNSVHGWVWTRGNT